MSGNRIENTLQQIERLGAGPGGAAPDPEARRRAASFIAQAHDAAAAGGADWEEPAVETGADGVVVFLWQDGLRGLSLSVGPAEAGTWVYAPGKSYGAIGALDFADNLAQGTASPAEFARAVWSPWARGEGPSA